MKIVILIMSVLALFFSGCSHHSAGNEMTQLQIRETQTRTFSTRHAKDVLKEMMNVLQDDQFIVKNANVELGLLTGEKDIDVSSGWERFFSILAKGDRAIWKNNSVIEVSANVTQFGDDTKVRVNFQRKLFDNRGGVIKVSQIYDQSYYQEFFDKVYKGLFIQAEAI